MAKSVTKRVACAAVLTTVALLLGTAGPSAAVDPVVFNFPAGVACSFELDVEVTGGTQVFKEFRDKTGNVARVLMAGRGSALVFTNVDTDESLSLKANGSVAQITLNADGSTTWMTTGHNVLILFPTDLPAGPSTTLTVGRVVFTVDVDLVFTVQMVSGRTTDICAALAA